MSSVDQHYEERPWDFPFEDDGKLRKAPSRAHLGCLPWERPRKWPRAFFSTAWMVMAHPRRAFSYEAQGGKWRPWLFLWLVYFVGFLLIGLVVSLVVLAGETPVSQGSIWYLGGTVFSAIFLSVAGAALIASLSPLPILVFGSLLHVFLRTMSNVPGSISSTFRALCYSRVTDYFDILVGLLVISILLLIPRLLAEDEIDVLFTILAIPLQVYGIYIQCLALDAAHGCGKLSAFWLQLLTVAALYVLAIILVGMFISTDIFFRAIFSG